MLPDLGLLFGLIAVALLFDFLNGLHDAANSIATIVSTRVLPPRAAVLWAAFFNFIAFLFFGLHVAQTLGTGIIDPAVVTPRRHLCRSHGRHRLELDHLVGRYPIEQLARVDRRADRGGVASAGLSAIVWTGVHQDGRCHRAFAGGWLRAGPGAGLGRFLDIRGNTPFAVDRLFRRLQFVSASLYSLGHGGNDAQKTMGIIAGLLFAQGHLGDEFYVPFGWSSVVRRRWRWARCLAAGAL